MSTTELQTNEEPINRDAVQLATVDTWLGQMLIASTSQGISHLRFGDDEANLREGFLAEKVGASIQDPDADFLLLVDRVTQSIGTPYDNSLVLDIHGTDFQLKVWEALQQIPFGQTVSYSDLAATIGRPSATRAVASACGANPIAVLIPCHRVIGRDGSLGGFRWGIERKRDLLNREHISTDQDTPRQTMLSFG